MHPLRKNILLELITNQALPFSKLRPKGIESNLFIYHLKQVITEGLVQKRKDGMYELTTQGKTYADHLSFSSLNIRIQPKIVTLIICQNKEGQLALFRRKRHPFLNCIGFPYGKIHLGESIYESADRELKEKTGLIAKLKHEGEAYVTVFQDDGVLSQMLCHIFAAKDPKGELITDSNIGECFWQKFETINPTELIPGCVDLYKAVKKNKTGLFFKELTYNFLS